jgi:trans-aconitate 2-methyltransferase
MENQKSKDEIVAFYDQYTKRQAGVGVNIRHRTILKRLQKAGLNKSSRVLEVGCGIGTLTSLLVKNAGHVTAVDISPESIAVAKNALSQAQNLELMVSDMSAFETARPFDFIVLPDVLEHIPIEQHARLFQVLSGVLHAHGVLAIHIPDPYALEWIRVHEPEALQIIDQSIYTDQLLPKAYDAGLALSKMERYALQRGAVDYQWLEFVHRPVYKDYPKKKYAKAVIDELKARI